MENKNNSAQVRLSAVGKKSKRKMSQKQRYWAKKHQRLPEIWNGDQFRTNGESIPGREVENNNNSRFVRKRKFAGLLSETTHVETKGNNAAVADKHSSNSTLKGTIWNPTPKCYDIVDLNKLEMPFIDLTMCPTTPTDQIEKNKLNSGTQYSSNNEEESDVGQPNRKVDIATEILADTNESMFEVQNLLNSTPTDKVENSIPQRCGSVVESMSKVWQLLNPNGNSVPTGRVQKIRLNRRILNPPKRTMDTNFKDKLTLIENLLKKKCTETSDHTSADVSRRSYHEDSDKIMTNSCSIQDPSTISDVDLDLIADLNKNIFKPECTETTDDTSADESRRSYPEDSSDKDLSKSCSIQESSTTSADDLESIADLNENIFKPKCAETSDDTSADVNRRSYPEDSDKIMTNSCSIQDPSTISDVDLDLIADLNGNIFKPECTETTDDTSADESRRSYPEDSSDKDLSKSCSIQESSTTSADDLESIADLNENIFKPECTETFLFLAR
ncbi:uncharacterized protein LOC119688620 [Teleopsis dalmanni]|uniref:uncharacterized protein LOC119688620 n=1 Tax=Teleopsis dalmanni TaxID=139649 RepID=UPI0018CE64F5|nr:uncharacterized protein LOC119688620 [Teleopsis dalmanni]